MCEIFVVVYSVERRYICRTVGIITSASSLWRLAVHRLVTTDVINIFIYIHILRYKGYSPLLLTLFREVIFIYGQSHPKYGR